jgi:hypothetical protein
MVNLAKLHDGLSVGGIAILIVLSLLQFTKIPINPWTKIFKWIGNKLNEDLKKDIAEVNTKLDKHIEESEKKDLSDTRRDILEFCNSCMNKRKHTQEQFKFIIKKCDIYEAYVEKHHIKNGEIQAAIAEIRRIYTKCLQENSFLKEGEE